MIGFGRNFVFDDMYLKNNIIHTFESLRLQKVGAPRSLAEKIWGTTQKKIAESTVFTVVVITLHEQVDALGDGNTPNGNFLGIPGQEPSSKNFVLSEIDGKSWGKLT